MQTNSFSDSNREPKLSCSLHIQQKFFLNAVARGIQGLFNYVRTMYLMFLKHVCYDVHFKAGHVSDINAEFEYFRFAVDDHPVNMNSPDEVFPVRKFSRSVGSCHRINDPTEWIRWNITCSIFFIHLILFCRLHQGWFEAIFWVAEACNNQKSWYFKSTKIDMFPNETSAQIFFRWFPFIA